ncbi:MAG: NTP transferase domain-containing protein [Acidobacteriota bacterium]
MSSTKSVASVIFAAGKGSRMLGFDGNKTLLPLKPGPSIFEGKRPLLEEVLHNLPPGPRGIVVNHRAEDVRKATEATGARYLHQPSTNGTGGALLAARSFLESTTEDFVVITMGDVPLIRSQTYAQLIDGLDRWELMVLAFEPRDRAQYGMLETDGDRLLRIVEWKYWSEYPPERQAGLRFCNAGVYAARRTALLECMEKLAAHPHHVRKQRGGEWVVIEEYFLTDIVEFLGSGAAGVAMAPEEDVIGVDTPEALKRVQEIHARRIASGN